MKFKIFLTNFFKKFCRLWIFLRPNLALFIFRDLATLTHTLTLHRVSSFPERRKQIRAIFIVDVVRRGIVRQMSSRVLNVFLWKVSGYHFFSNFTILRWLHLVMKRYFFMVKRYQLVYLIFDCPNMGRRSSSSIIAMVDSDPRTREWFPFNVYST
jgi:hypothetical protein